jgi:hypothetical protein
MQDGFRGYDRWKLASPDDERDEREAQRRRDEAAIERAEVMRDREKDERQQEAEIEMRMMHGGE